MPPTNTPASGFTTSEFITSLIPIAIGLLFVILGAVQHNAEMSSSGMTMLLGGSGIYGVSRGLTKLGAGIGGPAAPAPVDAPAPATPAAAAKAIANL